jgi:hypothetical protein
MTRVSCALQVFLLFSTFSSTVSHPWKIMSQVVSAGGQSAQPNKCIELVTIDVNDSSDSDSQEEVRPLIGDFPRGGGEDEGGKATILSSVFNLVNNVAGAGILTLASGMAGGTGLIPAMLICAVLGGLSGHCFAIIGEACELTGEADFKVRTDC